MNLSTALKNISYDSSFAVYAEKIDDRFVPHSPARFGQVQFENGGLMDDKEFVCNGEAPHDWAASWADGGDVSEAWEDLDIFIYELND